MASISNDPNGHRRIQFSNADGERKTLRLGKVTRRHAESVKVKVEDLVSANITGHAPRDDTSRWLVTLDRKLHDKLAIAGLTQRRHKAKLDDFIEGYLEQRLDVKPGTLKVMEQARRHLVGCLGAGVDIRQVTPADADMYKAYLLGRKCANSTVNKWIGYARHFFEVAKRRGMIEDNPFGHMTGAVKGDPAKCQFVPASDVMKLVEAAPDPQWKLLITLARWGGLRIPSEALALTWADVDFAAKRFIVRSSKTAHHADGGVRVVPMFPELTEYFQRVFDDAEDGTVHVITRYRDPAANLRTQLRRYITAAGLIPWPKPWQNLRVSRATELADEYPSHVCAGWLGHSEKIADAFYRQVTDDHFARATAQNAAQKAHETAGINSKHDLRASAQHSSNAGDIEKFPVTSGYFTQSKMGVAGFEPAT